MNIKHAELEEVDKTNMLRQIIGRQKELMQKYHDIELKTGLMQTEDCPVNLDDMRGQARIKDFSWRLMEEVGEALDGREDFEHFCEELIDGLHFLTELTILSGVEVDFDLPELYDSKKISILPELVCELVQDLGMMCNCLKNKPWKQSQMQTDKNNFEAKLKCVWQDYISILGKYLTPEQITEVYLKKSQVNKFRQRSNY